MNQPAVFRAIGLIGAVASIIVAVDQYFLDSALGAQLVAPIEIPAWLLALMFGCVSGLLYLAARQTSRDSDSTSHQRKITKLEARLSEYGSLENRILVLLETRSMSIDRLRSKLFSVPFVGRKKVIDAISKLLNEGKIERYPAIHDEFMLSRK